MSPVTQSSFDERHPEGYVGQCEQRGKEVESWNAAGSIGFGLAVVRTADDQVNVGQGTGASSAPFDATNFAGIALRDMTLRPDNAAATTYKTGDPVSVLVAGVVTVRAAAAVTQGEDVTFASTGRLSSAAASNTGSRRIPGAVWLDSASSGGLARIRLTGFRAGA